MGYLCLHIVTLEGKIQIEHFNCCTREIISFDTYSLLIKYQQNYDHDDIKGINKVLNI